MERPTNGELKLMIDNLGKDSLEKHHENKEILLEIRSDGKETKKQAINTNGRVSVLEVWCNDAKKIIEASSDSISNYEKDRVRIVTAIAIMTLVAGAIITLSIMAIDAKIERGITAALSLDDVDRVIIEN